MLLRKKSKTSDSSSRNKSLDNIKNRYAFYTYLFLILKKEGIYLEKYIYQIPFYGRFFHFTAFVLYHNVL